MNIWEVISSLSIRLVLLFILFSLIPIAIISVFGGKKIDQRIMELESDFVSQKIEFIAGYDFIPEKKGNMENIYSILENSEHYYFIVYKNGEILLFNKTAQIRQKYKSKIDKIINDLETKGFIDELDYIRNTYITSQKTEGGDYLVVIADFSSSISKGSDVVYFINMIIIFATLLTSVLWGIIIHFSIGIPIRVLTSASKKIASSNFNLNIDLSIMTGELKTFAETFISSSDKLEKTICQLIENESKYTEIFNSSLIGIMVHNQDGKILDANSAVLEMLKMEKKEDLLKMTIKDDLSDSNNSFEELQNMWDNVKDGSIRTFEWNAKRPYDDSIFQVSVSLKKVNLGYGEKTILANILDITDKKLAEEKLIRAQKLETVGTLTGGLAHDFNNILAGIMGPLSLIRNKLDKNKEIAPDKLEKYISMMENASTRAADVVRQLLSTSRKQELSFSSLDLNKSLHSIENIALSSFDKSINIKFIYMDSPAIVKADQTQIEQILLNLAVNAAHSMTIMRESDELWGGELVVSLEKKHLDQYFCRTHEILNEGYHFVITISDNGIGIGKSTIDKIFNPFFTTKNEGKGTGLGLSMVYNLISMHKGVIDVYSEEGIGSEFKIYLPIYDKTEKLKEEKSKLQARDRTFTETILIIDDEPNVLITAREMLESVGFTVETAENGTIGINAFYEKNESIDLILLDMSMPGLSGKVVYKELKAINPEIKIVLSSGFKQDERIKSTIEMGVNGFIQKPYSLNDLIQCITKALDDNK